MPEPVAGVLKRPFAEQVAFFRGKLGRLVPTERWTDMRRAQHDHGFMVAGAQSAELLAALAAAVDRGATEGRGIEAFRKDFRKIVQQAGWAYNGEENWRMRTIYHTNLRTSYMAGRWDELQKFPYLRYQHNTVANPRHAHEAWDGKIIARDDPWWDTHYPPNGWGCRCDVRPVSERMLRRMGKAGPDDAPPPGAGDPPPEWAYNVGEAAWGKPIAEHIIQSERGGKMVSLDARGPADFGRPDAVPVDVPRAQPGGRIRDPQALKEAFRTAIGGDSAVITDPAGGQINVTSAVIDHWLEDMKRVQGREQYLPLLRELIEDPYEIWAGFARNELTGRVELRRRYVKVIDIGKQRSIAFMADAVAGQWVGFNFFSGAASYADNLRAGLLVWGR